MGKVWVGRDKLFRKSSNYIEKLFILSHEVQSIYVNLWTNQTLYKEGFLNIQQEL
jgi:hypothetical protein